MAAQSKNTETTSDSELESLIEKLEPKHQSLFRSLRSALRKRLPTANELVYDYKDSLVIGYSASERGIEAVLALSARADGVRLYFNRAIPDPKKLLKGTGKMARYISVEDARQLKQPEIVSMIEATIAQTTIPFPTKGSGRLLIQSSSAKPKPSRKPAK